METNVMTILKPMVIGWIAFVVMMFAMGGPTPLAFIAGLAVSWIAFYITGFREASIEMSKILIEKGWVANAEVH